MKFKFDFVTNSSSTCYIVFVPNSFVVSDQMIQNGIDEEGYWWEFEDDETPPTPETMRQDIDECIETLKEGDNLYSNEYGDGVEYKTYQVLQNILGQAKLGINSVEMGSSSDDTILGISEEIVVKVLMNNINITDIIKVETNDKENKK